MKYEEPKLSALEFERMDVIRTSDGDGDGFDDVTGKPTGPGGTTGGETGGWGN